MKHKFYDFKDVRNYLRENFAYNIPDYDPPPELSGRLKIVSGFINRDYRYCYEIDQDETDVARWSRFVSRFYFKNEKDAVFFKLASPK